MTRLIDADALWTSIIQSRKETIIDDDVKISIGEFVKLLDNAPTVEVPENKKEATTAAECRSDYEEGYAKGFADGYERALRNTPTFPMVSTSPAHIVPDQLQGWRLEE